MTNSCFDQRSGVASPRHLQGLCDLTTLGDEKRDAGSLTTCGTFKAVQIRALNCSSKKILLVGKSWKSSIEDYSVSQFGSSANKLHLHLTSLQHKIKQNHKMFISLLPKWDRDH